MQLGAYGWAHASWNNTFYPEDLPLDWQLSYYSNEFNTVLVPASYWSDANWVTDQYASSQQASSCEAWLDSVPDTFQFYIECNAGLFADTSLASFNENLKILQPQLAGLVFLDEKVKPTSISKTVADLAEKLEIAVFDYNVIPQNHSVRYFQAEQSLTLALIENDLLDLRAAREIVDDFVAQYGFNKHNHENNHKRSATIKKPHVGDLSSFSEQLRIIVQHPELSANDLVKFRSVLEIMGF